jgi:hypothetical protein
VARWTPHGQSNHRRPARRLRTPLPRARRPTRRHRPDRRRQHHPPLHPLRQPRLPLQRRPPTTPRPYWQWTAKVGGKTVTRRLTERQAALYKEWIANDRKLRAIIAEMRNLAAKATELQLKEATDD